MSSPSDHTPKLNGSTNTSVASTKACKGTPTNCQKLDCKLVRNLRNDCPKVNIGCRGEESNEWTLAKQAAYLTSDFSGSLLSAPCLRPIRSSRRLIMCLDLPLGSPCWPSRSSAPYSDGLSAKVLRPLGFAGKASSAAEKNAGESKYEVFYGLKKLLYNTVAEI